METQEQIDRLIWDYLDGNLDEALVKEIDRKIAGDERWEKAYAEAFDLHGELLHLKQEHANPQLKKSVMERLSQGKKTKKRNGVITLIATFFGACIIYLFLKAFTEGGGPKGYSRDTLRAVQLGDLKPLGESFRYLIMVLNVVLLLVTAEMLLLKRSKGAGG